MKKQKDHYQSLFDMDEMDVEVPLRPDEQAMKETPRLPAMMAEPPVVGYESMINPSRRRTEEEMFEYHDTMEKKNPGKVKSNAAPSGMSFDLGELPLHIPGEIDEHIKTPIYGEAPSGEAAPSNYEPLLPQEPIAPVETPVDPVEEPTRQPSGDFDWSELLVGLVPSAISAMTGTTPGYHLGGKGLVDRQKSLEDFNRKLALQQTRAALRGSRAEGRGQAKVYIDDKGVSRYGVWDGQQVIKGPNDAIAGSASLSAEQLSQRGRISSAFKEQDHYNLGKNWETKVDENTGDLIKVDKQSGEIVPLNQNVGGLNPNQKSNAIKYVKDYNSAISKDVDLLSDLHLGFRNMNDDSQLGQKLGVMSLVKDIETRLSDYDRVYYTGETSILKDIHRRIDEGVSNEMNKRLINEARIATARALQKLDTRLRSKRTTYTSQLKGVEPGIDDKKMEAVFGAPQNTIQSVKMRDRDGSIYEVPLKNVPDAYKDGAKVVQ